MQKSWVHIFKVKVTENIALLCLRSGSQQRFWKKKCRAFKLMMMPLYTSFGYKMLRRYCVEGVADRWDTKMSELTRVHTHMYVVLHEVTWLYGVHRTCQDGSSFTWHQPCQHCQVHHFSGYSKMRHKKLVTHVEPHPSAVSLLESREQSYIKAINNNKYSYICKHRIWNWWFKKFFFIFK